MSKVLIIGGGAAGMMAAVAAGENGHEVWLYEKNDRLGRKLFITGKGRCNITVSYTHLKRCIRSLRCNSVIRSKKQRHISKVRKYVFFYKNSEKIKENGKEITKNRNLIEFFR